MENVFTTFFDLSQKGQENSANCVNCVKPLNYQTLPSKNETEEREGYYKSTATPVGKSRITSTRPGLNQDKTPITKMLQRVAMIFAVLVMSMANVGVVWGASPLIVDAPTEYIYTQDGVTVQGTYASEKINNTSSQSVFKTNSSSSIFIYSESTNINSISFKACKHNDGAGNCLDVAYSTGGAFTTPTSASGFTATKDGSTLSSLQNINLNGQNGTENTIVITFTSPVKAIILSKNSNDVRVRNISVAYGATSSYTTYYAAHLKSTSPYYEIDTDPGSASSSVTKADNGVTVNTKSYLKPSSDILIDLGSGHTFAAGDQIVIDVAGSGTNKSAAIVFKTSSGTSVATVGAGKVTTAFSNQFTYVVQASDGIQGQQSAKINISGSDTRIYSYSVVRASAAGSGWGIASSANSYTPASDEMSGSGTVTKTLSLSAGTDLQFKIVDISGNVWYGNGEIWGGTKTQSVSSTGTANNCHLLTTEAGNYTFSFNTSTKDLTITYPNSYTFYYANTGSWSKVYVYKFTSNGSTGNNAAWPGVEIVSPAYTCGGTDYYETTSDGYAKLIFTNNGGGDSNQTSDMVVSSSDAGKYTSGNKSGGTTTWNAFPTYTVTYNKNGDGAGGAGSVTGSVPTDSNSPYACGSTVTVLGNTGSLAKDGYNFIGWNTAPGGGGTSYVADATFTISANTTLYAQWELIPTYDVIYNTNGGTGGSTASQTGNLSGAQVTTRANGFTKTGYKFKWWNTAANGSGEDFYPGEKVTIASADVNLYAQWEEVASGWAYWVGDVNVSSTTTDITGNGVTMRFTNSGGAWNTDVSQDKNRVSKYNSTTDKHAKVLAVDADDEYLQVHFTDGKPINTLKLGVVNTDESTANAMVVLYSTTADFSSGEYEKVTHNSPGYTQATKSMTDFSPSTENKYYYARIYRKISTAVYSQTGGSGKTIRIYAVKAQKGATCTAPSTVTVTPTNDNGYRYTPGETISLTCTASGGSGGDYSYQWQKYYDSDWHDIADATSAVYSKSNCTTSDGGSYRCIVSTGEGCETISDGGDGYKIRVWTFNGNYSGSGFVANNITWTGANTGTVTLTLNANSTYEFKVMDNDGKEFGCNSGITADASNWTFYTNNGNCALTTGKVAGEYTFTIDITNVGSNNISVSVAYPKMRIYMSGGSTTWCNDDPVFFAHTYGGADNDVMMTAHSCEAGLFYADVPSYNSKVTFTRQKTGSTEIAWYGDDNYLNKSEDNISIVSNNLFTCTGWNTTPNPDEGTFSGSTYSAATYTISFDGGSGSTGSMSSISSIACGADQAITANSFEKTGYNFSCWHADVDVTVGGATVTSGSAIANSATIQNITGNITLTAQWTPDVVGHTVTYNYNGATGGAGTPSATGASVTLPNPTRTGYELDGWYTTAGEKVGAGGATYEPEADITLYARWEEECDAGGVSKSTADVPATGYTTYQEVGGSNVVFTSTPSLKFKYKTADGTLINNPSSTATLNNAYSCQIKSNSSNKGSIKTNSTFSNVDSISFYFAASDKNGCKIAVWFSTDNFSTDSTSLLSATAIASSRSNEEFIRKVIAIPSGKKANTLTFKFRFTADGSGKTCYMDSLKVYSSTTGGGTCYHVYYHGNGAESGYVNDTVSYTAGSKATVLNYNYGRYPLAKAGNDFQGWATSAGGAVAYTAGQKIDITSADVHLYAKWAVASTALVTWTMNLNTGTWGAASTSTTDGTNISSIGTARTGGGDSKKEEATAKVTMAAAEVSGTAAPSNSANFTFTIAGGKQVEINKFDCKVFNVASGNRTYKAQISDAAGNVYNSTNTVAVSAEATLTDASFVFGSTKILRGAVTIRVYAWGSGSEFRMGPDVKFYGTVDDYACATPSEPTISGVSEYVPGQTITLTATHEGENYDNLTTYTWYKGDAWGSKSQVQAAATGAAGYTFTKDPCAAGDAGKYWCEVANGTCNAHNSEGYNVIVYPTYSITWELNGGSWGEVEHKDSYTQFDEDYTLPTPTKTGFVFAGWYGASDFSGLPTVVLGAGSVGNKEYYAKWGAVVTVSWTVTKVDDELYRGGGGYSVKAVINEPDWSTGFMDELELTATEGVTLKNIEVSENGESKVQVTADFDITTDLAADATSITFTLNVPADGTYGPAELTHDEDLTSCAGSSTIWDFTTNDFLNGGTWSTSSGAENKAYATDGTTILKYYAGGSGDEWDSSNEQLKTKGATEFTSGTGKKQMTKKYFLFPSLSGKGTISVVYGTTSNDLKIYEATSNNIYGLEPIITLTSTSTTSASYTFDGDKKYYMNMESDKVYFKRITFTASSGGITPTLSWSPALASDGDWDSGNNRLNKETGDVDFTFVANQNKNSLGTITYSSSDETVATVNATTGKVHIAGAEGTATITATLAASGCFDGATATYTINVVDNCIDVPGTISTTDRGCSGIEMTVSGHTTSGETVSYQWYKVGTPDEIVGTNSATFTATEAGEYYVVVRNTGADHCAMASTNTIKVAAKAAISVPTNIVDSWYVKNGRRTPDIALWKTTGVSTFTVKNNASGATIENIGGCTFELKDGIIYLKGTTSDGAAPSGMEAGDLVIKVEVKDECGSNTKTSSTITIHRQAATAYKEIAFVADGGKGMKKDSITVGHGDGTELYEYLDSVGTAAENRLFKLSERNIYWTTDEKAIREEYSQFDAILITDDPSTNTVVKKGDDYKTKGYVNAFGTMVDVRPIFTMEAYVSALKNWGSKGIKGSPESPNPRQYEMRLECKDHEIYGAGLPVPSDYTNVWEETIGGETFRHVILVDSTKGVYKGVKYNKETKGNEKPALQGFTGEAAGSLLGLGRILEGTLQAAIERQEEPAARLLVMGINAKALQPTCALTNEGKTVIKNILIYLLKTNMEEVDDCSNYFTGKIDNDWSKADNWSKSALPSSEAKVRILAPCMISGIQPHVAQVAIVSSGESSIRGTNRNGDKTCDGRLTINADGALIVDGKVLAAQAPHFAANNLKPTTPEDLIINTNGSAQAALIFDNEEAKTKATVNYYSLGRKISGDYQYQYFAVPMEYVSVSPTFANENHGGTKIYTYVYNAGAGWTRRGYYDDLYAFEGLGITTNTTEDHMSYTMTGTLASTATQEISMSAAGDGYNLVGNSWMAPIQIAALSEDNTDTNITKTAYIYCTGHDGGTGSASAEGAETAGQWIPIPFAASGTDGWRSAGKLSVIPAMQAFQIKTAADATLTMDYSKVVRGSDNSLTERMRAPKRTANHTGNEMTIIRVSDTKTYTDVCLFEGEQFSEAFDNGWEAEYMEGDGRSAQFYAMNGEDKMAVMATDELEGTPVCFAPGKESNYTISFFGGDGHYYLNDLKEEKSTLMEQGNTYSFSYEEGDMPHRFLISTTPFGIPSVTTGCGGVEAQEKVQKVVYNDHVYIIRGGKIYDVMGKMMK